MSKRPLLLIVTPHPSVFVRSFVSPVHLCVRDGYEISVGSECHREPHLSSFFLPFNEIEHT